MRVSSPVPVSVSRDEWLRRFDQYLKDVRGLRPGSRRVYGRHVRDLLTTQFAPEACDLWGLSAQIIWDFIQTQSGKRRSRTIKTVLPAIRGFLRYLVLLGVCDASLVAAVPSVPRWRLSSLPRVPSEEEIAGLLLGFNRDTATGRRDYAIALCLIRLGLRAGEAANLTLDDVDWRGHGLRLTTDKERRVSSLPLPDDVAAAVVEYLQRGRPVTADRHVFVQHRRAPRPGSALTSGAVGLIIARGWQRSGLTVPYRGTHVLRHSLASRLLAGGADLKRIADILRQRSLDTTMIYSKVDRERLAEIVQMWPGADT